MDNQGDEQLPLTYLLKDRAILTLTGQDRKDFLQGLITNDIGEISENRGLYAALHTAQGKYLHDFFLTEIDETLYLDCERDRLPDLFRRLMMYKLRAKVEITDCSAKYAVYAVPVNPGPNFMSYPDPRHPEMGYRMIHPVLDETPPSENANAYDILRLTLGLPDGSRDFDVDKTLILEGNLEDLNGVDFAKGCYVGQEVTARMKHRTSLKKRLLPVIVDGTLPARGTEIFDQKGKKVGDIRSRHGNRAIGYFRLAHMTFGETYHCGEAQITPWRPDWLGDDH